VLILPRRFTQPPSPRRPNDEWVAQGLASLVVPSHTVDSVSGGRLTHAGADLTQQVPSQVGLATSWATPTAVSGITLANNPYAASTRHTTIALVRATSRPVDTATIALSVDYTASGNPAGAGFQFRFDSSGHLQICQPYVLVRHTGNAALNLNQWYVVGASVDESAGSHFYINGVLDSIQGWSASMTKGAQSSIGGDANDLQFNWRGQIALVAVFSGQFFNATQHAKLGVSLDAPWQLYQPLPRRIWKPVAAVVGGTFGPIVNGGTLTRGLVRGGRLVS
jgi:hypothetical protein